MLNETLAQVLAWLEAGGIVRITRIWLPISVACFVLTATLDGSAIYLEILRDCRATFNGEPIDSGANWFILYSSGMLMLAFLMANYRRSRLEDALNSTDYDVQFKFMAIYAPVLVFCVITLIPPVLSAVLYWKTATSSSCI